MKEMYPVIGNHESSRQRKLLISKVIPDRDSLCMLNEQSGDYAVDWNNVRFLVLNQYTDDAPEGCLGQQALLWASECISDARSDTGVNHVFVFYHEPAFPRNRHLDDSFNVCPKLRDLFWMMLVANRDIVRAVFNGHTHSYSRIRVSDPGCEEANNPMMFPDHPEGIYQIDTGASGQGKRVTLVRIEIDGEQITGSAIEADDGWKSEFELIDQWKF